MVHQPHRLAVAPGRGHAEVAGHVLLGVAALLLAEHHHRLVADAADAADEGLVIGTAAIAVELVPLIGEHLDVIEGAGALGVAGYLDFLGRAEVAEDFDPPAGRQGFQLVQLLADVHLGVLGQLADLLDLLLQFHQGFFELQQWAAGHKREGSGVGGETTGMGHPGSRTTPGGAGSGTGP